MKNGDSVVLTSGGEPMLVRRVVQANDGQRCLCVWFDSSGGRKEKWIAAVQLTRDDPAARAA